MSSRAANRFRCGREKNLQAPCLSSGHCLRNHASKIDIAPIASTLERIHENRDLDILRSLPAHSPAPSPRAAKHRGRSGQGSDKKLLDPPLAALNDIRARLRSLVEKLANQQAYLLIFGPLKSGKSTLMNAISGAYVSEVTSLPGYPCLVFVRHAEEPHFSVTRYNGREIGLRRWRRAQGRDRRQPPRARGADPRDRDGAAASSIRARISPRRSAASTSSCRCRASPNRAPCSWTLPGSTAG